MRVHYIVNAAAYQTWHVLNATLHCHVLVVLRMVTASQQRAKMTARRLWKRMQEEGIAIDEVMQGTHVELCGRFLGVLSHPCDVASVCLIETDAREACIAL